MYKLCWCFGSETCSCKMMHHWHYVHLCDSILLCRCHWCLFGFPAEYLKTRKMLYTVPLKGNFALARILFSSNEHLSMEFRVLLHLRVLCTRLDTRNYTSTQCESLEQIYIEFRVLKCCKYRKRGKFCWAKLSRFWPYEVFRGNTFAIHWSGM